MPFQYIRRSEAEQIKNLLAKMKKIEDDNRFELLNILGKNSLPENVIQKLLDWKHHNAKGGSDEWLDDSYWDILPLMRYV